MNRYKALIAGVILVLFAIWLPPDETLAALTLISEVAGMLLLAIALAGIMEVGE